MSLASPTKNNERIARLQKRAQAFRMIRCFFEEREVMEVDCPLLSKNASVDAHIDLIHATCMGSETRYLHSSPEYGMKRLLAEGVGDIYQLSHVFRDGEEGRLHNPEFMMCEWYRVQFGFEQMVQETLKFCRLFLGEEPIETLTYREAFLRFLSLDPYTASDDQLRARLDWQEEASDRDDLLNLIMGCILQPKLQKLTAITHYPASQAALAQTKILDGAPVAQRFEVFFKGVELANGYEEEADCAKLRDRFEKANLLRRKMGKQALPIDENFLSAVAEIPACCGVAVGIDRLLMLHQQETSLNDILPFSWQRA